jgi:hypothetical protein
MLHPGPRLAVDAGRGAGQHQHHKTSR